MSLIGSINSVLPKKHLIVIAGHYGSGKTEIALNLSIALRQEKAKVTLVDLDIVNPFFRSAEQEKLLASHGVDLLKPIYANTSVDIPSLPPQILGVFAEKGGQVIFDVGGDDAGAAALGAYAPQFATADKVFYMVVNPYRPRSGNVKQIVEMYNAISRRARMMPDALICNANLGDGTCKSDILEGLVILRRAAEEIDVPIAYICALEGLCPQLACAHIPLFPVKRYLKPEWMEE